MIFGSKYKTIEGARKRAAFERSMNPSEFRRGDAARLYEYRVVQKDGFFRIDRTIKAPSSTMKDFSNGNA